jgi:hypothetical protein
MALIRTKYLSIPRHLLLEICFPSLEIIYLQFIKNAVSNTLYKSPPSHHDDLSSIAGQHMLYLLRTKWYWGNFSPSNSAPLANCHSTNSSTLIYHHHLGLV